MAGKKGYLEFSFTWLFAIIVGMVILFLAIFLSGKIIKTGTYEIDTKTAKEIGIITNPLEMGYESSTGKTILVLNAETRFYSDGCILPNEDNLLGKQKIKLAQKTFSSWPEPGGNISFMNKYFYSNPIVEGKKFYIFSKPFSFPYKIADLVIFISASDEYCFINAPDSVKETIERIEIENLKLKNCSATAEKVCFNSAKKCEINVFYNEGEGYVEKNNERMYFVMDYSEIETEESSLMYSAIFSYKKLYECNLKRLMARAETLAKVYNGKAEILSQRQCNTNMVGDLTAISGMFENLRDSKDLGGLYVNVYRIGAKNDENVECKLW